MPFVNGQPWRLQYGENPAQPGALGGWSINSSVAPAIPWGYGLCCASSVVAHGFLFVFCGINVVGTSSRAYRAYIDPTSGVLSAWVRLEDVTAGLDNAARYGSQAVMIGSKVYLIGGVDVASILSATIGSDGSISTWSAQASGLPVPLGFSQAIVTTNRIFMIGGYTTSWAPTSGVYSAPISEAGVLGTWSAHTPFPATIAATSAIRIGASVYTLGGKINGVVSSAVYKSAIDADGLLGSWALQSTIPLPAAREESCAVVTTNGVYLIGGYDGGTPASTVYSSPISGEVLGAWSATGALSRGFRRSAVAVANEYVFLTCGMSPSVTYDQTVQFTAFDGGSTDYTSWGYNSLSTEGPIIVSEPADTVSALTVTSYTAIFCDEEADEVSASGWSAFAGTIYAQEEIDTIDASTYSPNISQVSTSEEIDTIDASTYSPNISQVSTSEEIDDVSGFTFGDGSAIQCSIAAAEYVDGVSTHATNQGYHIAVEEGGDGVNCVATAWNAGSVKIREYHDSVSAQRLFGELWGSAFISEPPDVVGAASTTSNVGRGSITCELDGVGSVATTDQLNAGAIALAEVVDTISFQAICGVGAVARIDSSLDEVSLLSVSGIYGVVVLDEPMDWIKLLSRATAGSIPLFEFTRPAAVNDGELLPPGSSTVLHFNRTVPALGALVENTVVEPFHFSR